MEKVELEKAFIAVVREYERVIYKVCSFYVSDGFPLADLYQEVVCNLWVAFPKFRNESSISTRKRHQYVDIPYSPEYLHYRCAEGHTATQKYCPGGDAGRITPCTRKHGRQYP